MYVVLILIFLLLFVIKCLFYKNNYKNVDLFLDSKWKRYNNILQDGSCFYHSVLFATSSNYRLESEHNRRILAQTLRKNIFNFFTYEYYEKHYKGFGEYSDIKNNILFEWAGNIQWKIMCDFLDIQIIIFREKTNSLYWGYDKPSFDKKLIFILNTNDNHFEPICFHKNSNFQYIFHYNNYILSLLKKIKCKN